MLTTMVVVSNPHRPLRGAEHPRFGRRVGAVLVLLPFAPLVLHLAALAGML